MAAYIVQQLFFDLDAPTVTQIRDKAIDLILEGKTLMTWGTPGFNAGKQFVMHPNEMLAEANAALRFINGGRVTKTFPNFSNYGRVY